ncbi:hypothetical protein TVAG_292490 [Trichomonas vaginalis G3]|uniref:Uncharacterized protein n=1 Tax=Trichomonas vaginalis (strain ATCC PRA-98 / G3) TaxID=412133 RepID=A2F0C1_TRIV3|nr:hypothetical protein TVAGG3_0216280 [Trichomonas vaginalis G3]EAY01616.1 hypothetical protein TVAG_292490 [Trichomonas vaginalis G3]KAI5551580.1 hypothetical protein TVAGG3_0216280 [Trichomonas vaginalis G3]|eukprot:XP_001314233.1 hypothetical protein [Trichomonas vaginalis G3]
MTEDPLKQADGDNRGLGEVLHSVLSTCERELQSVISPTVRMSTKKNVMHSLLKTEILLARFLVLYRWVKKSETTKIYNQIKNAFEENTQKVRKKYRQIRNAIKTDSDLKTFEFIPQVQPIEEIVFNTSPRNIYLCLLQQKIPSEITSISLKNKTIFVTSNGYYNYSVKISHNGGLHFSSLNLLFPTTEKFSTKILLILSQIVEKSESLFYDIHTWLKRLYTIGQFVLMCEKLKKHEKIFGYSLRQSDGSVHIIFGANVDYQVEFNMSPTDCGICIFSSKPLERPDKTKSFYKAIFANSYPDIVPILSEMRDIAHYSIISSVSNRLSHAFVVAGFPSFMCECTRTEIVVKLNGRDFCRVFLSRFDSNVETEIFDDIGVSGPELVHCLSCDECERISISHSLYLVSVVRDLLNLVEFRIAQSFAPPIPVKSVQPRAIRFSFAPDFVIKLSDTRGRPRLDVISNDGVVTSTNEMILLNETKHLFDTRNKLLNAVLSAKPAVVILQLQKFLFNEGIESHAENNKIHFQIQPFECVEFRCDMTGYWTLFFVKPLPLHDDATVCIHGNGFSSDFCQWLKRLITVIGLELGLVSQLESISMMKNIISKFCTENKLQFSNLFQNTTRRLNLTVNNVQFIEKKRNVEHFKLVGYRHAHLSFETLLNTFDLFSTRIDNSMYLTPSLVTIHKAFADRPNWSIQMHEQFKVLLIFMRRHMMKINFNSFINLHVQISVTDEDLQIPMHKFVYQHTITIMQIEDMRKSVEEFFALLYCLEKYGFQKHENYKTEISRKGQVKKEPMIRYLPQTFGELTVNVLITTKGPQFEFQGRPSDDANKFMNLLGDGMQGFLFKRLIGFYMIDPQLGFDISIWIPKIMKTQKFDCEESLKTIKPDLQTKIFRMKIIKIEDPSFIGVEISKQNDVLRLICVYNGNQVEQFSEFRTLTNFINAL